MEDFIEKIPNWLRYILAIPFGFLFYIVAGFIILLSQTMFAAPDSLWVTLITFIFSNGINYILFFYGFNLMLPNHKFVATLSISIIFGIIYSIIQGMSIITNTITFEYIAAFILTIVSLIISCYISYKEQ